MFFAEKSDNVTLRTYFDLVNQLVEKRDDTHKDLIDKIILTTAEVGRSDGKNLNSVDSSIFYVVNELYNSNGSYFASTVNSKLDITNDVYSSLKAFLSTLVTSRESNMC